MEIRVKWPRVLMSSDFNQFVELEKGKPVIDTEEAYTYGNWVTNSISSGERPIRRMGSEVRIHGENGVDDISAGAGDAPGVGAAGSAAD